MAPTGSPPRTGARPTGRRLAIIVGQAVTLRCVPDGRLPLRYVTQASRRLCDAADVSLPPRLVALEKLADEIRMLLAATPTAMIAAPPHIPPGLMARIEEYNSDRQKFIAEFDQAVRAASSAHGLSRSGSTRILRNRSHASQSRIQNSTA